MKKNILLSSLFLAALGGLLFFVMAPAPEAKPKMAAPEPVKTKPQVSQLSSPVAVSKSPTSLPPSKSGPDAVSAQSEAQDAEVAEIQDKILEGVVTYSKEGLPAIEPYLMHPNLEVREQAIDGMIQISVPEAAPILRKAAQKTSDPMTKVKLLEAAEFVEMPSIPPDVLRKK